MIRAMPERKRFFAVDPFPNFSDDAEPPIKHALISENIHHANIFKLNTIFVENGTSSFEEFLDYLNSTDSPQELESRSRRMMAGLGKTVRNGWNRLRSKSRAREQK